MAFEVHPRLASGGFDIGRIGKCRLLLKDNALFPWFILIPEVEGVEDLHELPLATYNEVMATLRDVSEFIASYFQPEKLNIGCIGNQVRQMHLQIIARSSTDLAWPGTVWAFPEKQPYTAEARDTICAAARSHLGID